MNREDYVKICDTCSNKKFNIEEGLLCSLTNKKADFIDSCINYKSIEHKKSSTKYVYKKSDKGIQNITTFLFYLCLLILSISYLQRSTTGSYFITFLGLLGFTVYIIATTVKHSIKTWNLYNATYNIILILMSLIIFSKYLYHYFGDKIGLIIIPLFIIISIFDIFIKKNKWNKIRVITITYLILCIPILGFEIDKQPRHYIPKDWYDKMDKNTVTEITVELPYEFKNKKTEDLNLKAKEYLKINKYNKAIETYYIARKLEPNNPRILFDLANVYTRKDELENAIKFLDTAIIIDDKSAPFYNNRGLLRYKLKKNKSAINDFKQSLNIEPNNYIYYVNIALAYHRINEPYKSCISIQKSEELGLKLNEFYNLEEIKKEVCN